MLPLWALSAGGFIKRHWQLVLIAALVIAAFFYIRHIKHEAYQKGKADCNAEWNQKIAKEDKANRKFEKELQEQMDQFAKRFAEEQAAKEAKEAKHADKIREIIKEKPVYQQCKVDQEVLDERNKIRSMP